MTYMLHLEGECKILYSLFLLFSYCIVGPMSMYIYIYIYISPVCIVVISFLFSECNKN